MLLYIYHKVQIKYYGAIFFFFLVFFFEFYKISGGDYISMA